MYIYGFKRTHMLTEQDHIKMIFGFKLKYLRQQKALSLQQLAEQTGLSTSYIHDLEKGKKYPKVDKISLLAQALGVNYDFLVSRQADKKLQPAIDLLGSEFFKEFPLELFGLGAEMVFDLFSNAPEKVVAFISTILKITRNYQMQREHVFMTALRSYQDMFDNYFGELEDAVRVFRAEKKLSAAETLSVKDCEALLHSFQVAVDRITMGLKPELKSKRSYFAEASKTLFLNSGLQPAQEKFLLCREIAFQYLDLSPRPYVTRISEITSFDMLLNNFKASYFAVALLMDEHRVKADIQTLAASPVWEAGRFRALLQSYEVTPEMFMQRLTNILPHHFGLKDLFFLRISGDKDLKYFRMSKELHLSQLHSPYANEANEHYCRRWVSVNIIKHLRAKEPGEHPGDVLVDAQVSCYFETEKEYLCISMAKWEGGAAEPGTPVSVTIGLLANDALRRIFRFLDDPALSRRVVHTTCEQCSIMDCDARAAPPKVLQQQKKLEREQQALEALK